MSAQVATCQFVLTCDQLLVIGTWLLAAAAIASVWIQSDQTRRALHADTFARITARWDAVEMRVRRRKLATALRSGELTEIPPVVIEDVIGFFEDMGVLLRKNWLGVDVMWQSFDTAARHYWAACSRYVSDRRQKFEDDNFYSEFKYLSDELAKEERKRRGEGATPIDITLEMVEDFLVRESDLA